MSATMPSQPAGASPAIEGTLTLKALERTLHLVAESGSGTHARIVAVERDAAGKIMAMGDVLAGEIVITAPNGYSLVRLGSSAFYLTPKGAARVRAWLQQLQGAP
jgi:hypothetical protein